LQKARQRSKEQCGNALRKRGSAPKNSAETRFESAAALRNISPKRRDTHTCASGKLEKHLADFRQKISKFKREKYSKSVQKLILPLKNWFQILNP
jgi:uncharacterized membrane protein